MIRSGSAADYAAVATFLAGLTDLTERTGVQIEHWEDVQVNAALRGSTWEGRLAKRKNPSTDTPEYVIVPEPNQ